MIQGVEVGGLIMLTQFIAFLLVLFFLQPCIATDEATKTKWLLLYLFCTAVDMFKCCQAIHIKSM